MKRSLNPVLALLVIAALALATFAAAEAPTGLEFIDGIDVAVDVVGDGDLNPDEPGELALGELVSESSEMADAVVVYRFIVDDAEYAVQEAREGEAIACPETPVAPEGTAFEAWVLADGAPLFADVDGDGVIDPVVAHVDEACPEIIVWARFAQIEAQPEEEQPAEEAPTEEAPVEEQPDEEVPAEEAPVEEVPAEEVPAEEVPAEEVPAEEVPAEEVPAEEAPAEEVPAEEAPAEEVPAEEAPAEEQPAEEAPAEEVPAEEAPAEEQPAEEVPAEEAPVEEQPAEEQPAEEVPAEEAPVEEQPAEEVPAEEAPVEEVPAEEAPVEEQPAEEIPAEEQPAEEVPAEEAPAEEQPAEEQPVEGMPVANALVYTGEAQPLVSAGEGWLFSVDGVTYSPDIPTAIDAGDYTVYFMPAGAAGEAAQALVVTVAKADVILVLPEAMTGEA